MRILLLGKYGQLGWEFQRTLPLLGEVTALDRDELDLTQTDSLRTALAGLPWDVLVNASAYTAVDRAEVETDAARRVNADAPRVMAEESQKRGAIFIHVSTDYVFDGTKTEPYLETDLPNPGGCYARTKWEGEQAVQASGGFHFIFRASWVYSLRGDNFVTKVIKWSRQRQELRIVTDQVACPTWSRTLAELISHALFKMLTLGDAWTLERRGLYHLASADYASRYDLACFIVQRLGLPVSVHPALTREFPSPVKRPAFSALASSLFSQTFRLRVPGWREMLALALEEAE